MRELIDRLAAEHSLTAEEWTMLIDQRTPELEQYAAEIADQIRREVFQNKIYIRGLIELSSYCKNDCYYCGIRCGNLSAQRYRLTKEEILVCCAEGYELGFRTFVLQGGEDLYYTDSRMVEIIAAIKAQHPDCAITLSIGEKDRATYQAYFDAGADRYLLRHETATKAHYQKLHPESMQLENRLRCLTDLKEIGFQVGCGFMVGSPYQTNAELANDLAFLQEFQPHMVGIGPFIPHKDTPFGSYPSGSADLTVYLLSLIRILLPNALIPATTALGTISADGRERGILAGANVVMPNLSPTAVRKKYLLYDNKLSTGDESAQQLNHLRERMKVIGFQVVTDRGDHPSKS